MAYAKFVSFPYLLAREDGGADRAWAHMRFNSATPISKRLIKKSIRKWVKVNLGRSIHPRELHSILKLVNDGKAY